VHRMKRRYCVDESVRKTRGDFRGLEEMATRAHPPGTSLGPVEDRSAVGGSLCPERAWWGRNSGGIRSRNGPGPRGHVRLTASGKSGRLIPPPLSAWGLRQSVEDVWPVPRAPQLHSLQALSHLGGRHERATPGLRSLNPGLALRMLCKLFTYF
jgi:hypothetical protein